MIQIDINRSIQKQRLFYKPTGEIILETILDNLLWVTWLVVSILLLTDKNNYKSDYSFIPIIITLLINIWLITGIWMKNKMLKISYKDLQTNREFIISLFSQRFPKLHLDDSNSRVITFEREVGLFNWGRTIVIIFDNNDIYINWTTLGRFDIKSPFHAPFNYTKLIRIREQMQKNGS